eukprot:m.248136 g.248136  ORF g.248136 m.248136 type:complete len:218 (+) comp16131_c0_seq35:227-880(+)
MSVNGLLTWESFCTQCQELVQCSRKIARDARWEWVESPPLAGSGVGRSYMRSSEQLVYVADDPIDKESEPNEDLIPSLSQLEGLMEEDAGVANVLADKNHFVFEHNIVYSTAYSVPVLLFRASKLDGQPLNYLEVWQTVPKHIRSIHDQMVTLTQVDHPVLGTPYYQLHPCNTGNLMKDVLTSDSSNRTTNYVGIWISLYGPAANLSLPHTYFVRNK